MSHAPPAPSRRAFLGGLAGVALAAGLSGCATGRTSQEVSFHQSKPEAIPYFGDLLQSFNQQASGVRAVHDTSSGLSAGFARGNPPDLGCLNYNYEIVRFQERGAFSDLADLAGEANIAPSIQDLIDQYPTYPGRTSVIPYSMMAAAVLYNQEIFAEHDLEIPTTYSELLEVCGTLEDAGVTPIYSTYADPWTVAQGLVDYTVGGALDVAQFFEQLRAQGPDAGPEAPVSFSRNLREPLEQMLEIAAFSQPGAASRGYGDGNVAFAAARPRCTSKARGRWGRSPRSTPMRRSGSSRCR